jgi:hypothetical protein
MFARRLFSLFIVSLAAAAVAACGSGKEIPPADSVATLAESLKAAGLSVNGPAPNDVLASHYFSIPGVSFQANGETLHAYEFDSEDAAAGERSIVSADGYGIGSKYIQWETAPSFYNSGRLIVIYDGDKSLLENTLASAMGDRFAGSEPES